MTPLPHPNPARIAAVFDLDGTLLAWPSAELRLGWALWMTRLQHGRRPERRQVVERLATHLATRLHPAGRRQLDAHRAAGHRVLLLSGAPHDLVAALARVLDCAAGRGARAGVIPRGATKRALLLRWARRDGWEARGAFAYANAAADRHLLQAVGHAVVVDPDQRLRREARRRGWQIRHWNSARPPAALLHERLGLAFTLWLASLAALGGGRVPHAFALFAMDALAATAWTLLIRSAGSADHHPASLGVKAARGVRPWVPLLMFILWFEQSGCFAHLVRAHWQDAGLIAFDRRLLGMDAARWCAGWARPWVTEVMQGGYFSYYFLLPLVAGVLWAQRRRRAVEQLLLASTLAYIACNLVYPFFPVQGPFHSLPQADVAPSGGFFNACVNWVESWGRVHGSAFPSAHVAGAVTVWLGARRGLPRLAVVLAPLVLVLCAATIYGRFHYIGDVLGGLGVALLADHWAQRFCPTTQPETQAMPSSLGPKWPGAAVLGLLLLCTPTSRASVMPPAPAPPPAAAFEATIQAGLRAMYDAQYAVAIARFETLRHWDAGHPAPDVYELLVDWWEVMGDPGNDVLAARFSRDATRAMASTQAWVHRHPDDAEGWLYRSSAYGARGRYAVTVRPSPLHAVEDGLAAYRAVQLALARDPRLADAGLGTGAYDYFSATLPPFIRPVAWLLGFRGSRERGLQELQTTMTGGRHARTEAALLLLSAYWSENHAAQFARLATQLRGANPHNPVLAGWQVSGDLHRKAWAEAEADIERDAAELHDPAWSAFQQGRLHLARGEATAAARYFSTVIVVQPANHSLVAWAYEGRARARERLRLPATADHEAAQRLAPHALVFANQILTP